MSIRIDYDALEWWEMPKRSPQWIEHQRKAKEERDAKSRAEMRFQGETGRVKRRLIKERGEMCQHCGRNVISGQIERLHAHHIIHKVRGGTNDPSNLVLLCRACHELEHLHGVGR